MLKKTKDFFFFPHQGLNGLQWHIPKEVILREAVIHVTFGFIACGCFTWRFCFLLPLSPLSSGFLLNTINLITIKINNDRYLKKIKRQRLSFNVSELSG